jgi:hypothetical protein
MTINKYIKIKTLSLYNYPYILNQVNCTLLKSTIKVNNATYHLLSISGLLK